MFYISRRHIAQIALGTALMIAPTAASAGNLDEGETPWRWIGLLQESSDPCPEPPSATGWQTERLFVGSNNPQLRRFCLYEHDGVGDPNALLALPLVGLDPDVMGIAPLGSDLALVSRAPLEDHFLQQAGQVALPGASPMRIRLAVLDSSPDGIAAGAVGPEDVPASSPHGTALLNMARDLVCDPTETSCRATVASRLVMSWECFHKSKPAACRDTQNGGYVGLIGELAQAIHGEVSAWKNADQEERLILNLSLGWHQELGGHESQMTDMPTSVQAVYRALEDAVCRGALPIAAAGNRDASPTSQSGPFLPALWETRSAPSRADCQGLGITSSASGAAYRPLIFSAAGVKDSGDPLDTTRPNGIARLAAFADHAVVGFSDTQTATGTLTGSSVAALVVSSAAAAVWSYLPSLDSFQVMSAIYGGASSLGRPADYTLGGTGPADVRRVSVCDAVAAACAQSGQCPVPTCPTVYPFDVSGVDFTGFDPSTGTLQVDVSKIDDPVGPTPECGSETVLYNNTRPAPADACPHRQYEGTSSRPWTEPQPDSIPCPNCLGYYNSPGKYFVEIDDTWVGTLTDATLRCGSTTYALGLPPLSAGDKVRLYNVPEECLSTFPTFLSFASDNGTAVLSPLRLCAHCH